MSTIKVVAVIGLCLLLAGCAPVIGLKGGIAFVASIAAAIGAGWGIIQEKAMNRVCQKAQKLDDAVTDHKEKYHPSYSVGIVTDIKPSNKGNGVAVPDSVSNLSQRM